MSTSHNVHDAEAKHLDVIQFTHVVRISIMNEIQAL